MKDLYKVYFFFIIEVQNILVPHFLILLICFAPTPFFYYFICQVINQLIIHNIKLVHINLFNFNKNFIYF